MSNSIYSNSYHPDQSHIKIKKKEKGISFLTYFILGVIFIISMVVFVQKAQFLQVKSINVSINNNIIKNLVYDYVNNNYKNILFTSPKKIKTNVQVNFLELSNILVKRSLLNRSINISADIRSAKYAICNKNNQCFLADSNGGLFKKETIENTTQFIIQDNHYQLGLNNKIPKEFLKLTKNFITVIEKFELSFNKVIIENNYLIIFVLNNDIKVRFALEKNTKEQLSKINSFLSSFKQKELENIEYIDLRVQDKVYYRNNKGVEPSE